MNQFVSSALVNISNCFRVVFNLDNAKDTLGKEIVNDELIVSVIDIKATSHDILIQDKVVTVNYFTNVLDNDVDVDDDDEINEVLTVHLVKIIVPFFLEHQSVLDRSNRSRIAQLLKCFISNPQSVRYICQ